MSYFESFPVTFYDVTKPGDIETNVIITKDIIRRVKLNSRVANSAFSYDPYDIQEGERPDTLAHQFYNSSKFAWVIMVTNEIHDLYEDWPRTERELKNMINKKYGGMGPYAVKGTETSTGNYYSGVNGYYYPLFLSIEEARNYDRLKEFSGGAHTHTFSEFPNTVFYMPDGPTRGHGTSSFDTSIYKLYKTNSGPDGIHHYEYPQASGDTTKKVITTATTYTEITSPGTEQTKNTDAITNRVYEERINEAKRQINILRPNLLQEFVEEFRELIKE